VKGNFIKLGTALIVACLSLPAKASDDASNSVEASANVGFVSEYLFRGVSQTDDTPAVQGGLDLSLNLGAETAIYVGAWGSNVKFTDASAEIDYYAGIAGPIGNFGTSFDIGGIYYTYPGSANSLNYDFIEAQVGLSQDLGFASIGVSLNYSPENFGDSGEAYYPKLSLDIPVGDYFSIGGYLARQYVEDNTAFALPDYNEWNASVSGSVYGFDLALAYSDTDVGGDPDGSGPAVIASIARSF